MREVTSTPPAVAQRVAPDGRRAGRHTATGDEARARRWERRGLVVGVAIVVVHALLTIDARALWLDEAYSLGAANFPGLSLSRTRGTMGLYYVILWAWAQVSVATWWLRLPSVAWALASLFVVRAIARRIGSRYLAALAVPFLALSTMFEWKATEARAYSLEILLVATAWYVTLRALDEVEDDRDLRWWLALVPLAVAGVFCHGLVLVHLAPIGIVALCGPRPLRSAGRVLPALGAAGAAALWLRSAGASEIGTSVAGGAPTWTTSTLTAFLPGTALARLVLAAGLVLGLYLTVRQVANTMSSTARAVRAVPVAWAVGPCVALGTISVLDPLYNPRYLAPIAPGVALVLAAGAVGLPSLLRDGSADPNGRVALPARVMAATLGLALVASLLTSPPPIVEEWREAASIVADRAQPGDALLFANLSDGEPEQQRPPFEAAWAEVDHPVIPTVVSSPRPLGPVRRYDTPRSAAAMGRAAATHDRIWIIDGGSGGSAGREAILADPAFASFRVADYWLVPDDIEVVLYQRG